MKCRSLFALAAVAAFIGACAANAKDASSENHVTNRPKPELNKK